MMQGLLARCASGTFPAQTGWDAVTPARAGFAPCGEEAVALNRIAYAVHKRRGAASLAKHGAK